MSDLNRNLSPEDKQLLRDMNEGYSPCARILPDISIEFVPEDMSMGRTAYDDLASEEALGLEDVSVVVARLNRSFRQSGGDV